MLARVLFLHLSARSSLCAKLTGVLAHYFFVLFLRHLRFAKKEGLSDADIVSRLLVVGGIAVAVERTHLEPPRLDAHHLDVRTLALALLRRRRRRRLRPRRGRRLVQQQAQADENACRQPQGE